MLRKNSSDHKRKANHLSSQYSLSQARANSYQPRRHGVASPKQEKASVTVAVLKSVWQM